MATFDFSIKPIEALRNDLDRLTVLRGLLELPPVANLISLMNDLLSDEVMPFDIQWAYHDFAAVVLSSEPPAVTGDHWRDCLMEAVLERENVFSLAAARGRLDDVLSQAYSRDLAIVQTLFLLDDAMLRNWCAPSQRGADVSGWASFSNVGFYIVEGEGPLPAMRRMLLSSEDWSQLAKPLGDLHAQFGAGAMVGHRYIEMTHEGLRPVARVNARVAEADERLLSLFMEFSQGAEPEALLVTGAKALLAVRSALVETPLHIVRLGDPSLYTLLCDRLCDTRMRFAVLLPPVHPMEPLFTDLLGDGISELPRNLLPIMVSPVSDSVLTSLCTHIQV